MKQKIRVGSRESALAMAQSKLIIQEIASRYPHFDFELISMKTSGDIFLDTRLEKVGGKGLFIKELEQALINHSIDLAVHSMKDIPAEIPDELEIAAVSKREDPRDVLITLQRTRLSDLPGGAVIGTSSIRREVQIHEKRPDLTIKTLRGNVLTRINKLLNQEFDAIVLAAAGLKRLGLEERCEQYFSIDEMIPAVCQGVLAIETRKNDPIVEFLVNSVHSPETALAVAAERAFMIKLNGGCTTPIAAHAVIEGEQMKVYGLLALAERTGVYRASVAGSKYNAVDLGVELADKVLELFNRGTNNG
jgi:hydroxymethylbilane synthase